VVWAARAVHFDAFVAQRQQTHQAKRWAFERDKTTAARGDAHHGER